jgi:8-oxo-dGTP pyrophosphatase MutT (NUDIX family)
MDFPALIHRLEHRLKQPLPGLEAQRQMIPADRPARGVPAEIPATAKRSAVLLLLYPEGGLAHLPMILRNTYKGVHSAQVGLPGGQAEEGDADEEATALREAWEEIGIERQHVQVLGRLSPLYIPVSNFHVQPIVGMLDFRPDFMPDPAEVAELLPTSLAEFHKPEIRVTQSVTVGGNLRMNVPGFWLHDRLVWGATAMIMSEFLEVAGVRV